MANKQNSAQPKNEGAIKAGPDGGVFDLSELPKMDTGPGYSTANGPVVEGEQIQVGLMKKARGTGARPHKHPNEQWNYIVSGKVRVKIEGKDEVIAGPGSLLYFPANKIHSTVALPEEDVFFLAIKDMSYGIIGKAADGTMSGPHYEPGFAPEAKG